MARKKTVLLRADYEDLLARVERILHTQTEETDLIIPKLSEGAVAYYYGRRSALTELRDFIAQAKAEYLKG